MRDLAGSRAVGARDSRRKIILVVVVVVISAIVGFVLMQTDGRITTPSNSSVVLRDAPTNLTPVDVGEPEITGGVDLATETAQMRDVRYGGQAKATITRAYGGDLYVLNVDATLPDPVNQKYYVWLGDSRGKYTVINPLKGSKTHWTMGLRDRDKFSSLDKVLITLERTQDDLPEEHIMEGSF